ncbi:MAG: hypothetical protein DWP97_11870 [Calditrichaeota bacterium]|nr:MAG: hypothetical protein DWP97_11870 [Calditrichota bacterium]
MNIDYVKSPRFYIPTLSFIVFLAIFVALFQSGEKKYTAFPRMLTQWDGQHYLSIARDGYKVEPCTNRVSTICGNVGWFPGYPLVAYLLSWIPLNIQYILIGLSWLSFWLALLLLYGITEDFFNQKIAVTTLIALFVFPTSFYFLTVFPYSLYLLTVLVIFKLFFKKNYILLTPLCGLLAVIYPSGIVITLPLLIYMIIERNELPKSVFIKIGSAITAVGAGLILYCLYYYVTFDNFFLYTDFQSQWFYAHKAAFPLYIVLKDISTMEYQHPVWIMLLFIPLFTSIFFNKKVNIYLLIYMFGIFLFTPTAGTTDCFYRHILVAFPFFIMIGSAIERKKIRYLLPLYIVISLYYMFSIYLPYYKTGQLM